MAHQIATIRMTLSELQGHLCTVGRTTICLEIDTLIIYFSQRNADNANATVKTHTESDRKGEAHINHQ